MAGCLPALLAVSLTLGATPPSAERREYDRYLQPGTLVDIGGRRLNLRCEGAGGTGLTILLESGLAFSSIGWRDAQPLLAKHARTCAYDRAGLGFSDPGPMPRDASALADDLARLVDAAGLKPPFLLVGNSMGSQTLRLFAFRRPGDVAGMILLDPYVEGENQRLAAIEPKLGTEAAMLRELDAKCMASFQSGTLTAELAEQEGCIASAPPGASAALQALLRQQRMSRTGFEAAAAETAAFETMNDAILARLTAKLGALPLLILSARRNYSEADLAPRQAELLDAQFALHQSIAALLSCGVVRWADADHVIQTSNPVLVEAAVAEMLRSLPSRSAHGKPDIIQSSNRVFGQCDIGQR